MAVHLSGLARQSCARTLTVMKEGNMETGSVIAYSRVSRLRSLLVPASGVRFPSCLGAADSVQSS